MINKYIETQQFLNLSFLFRNYPEVKPKIERIFIMGGAI